MKKPKVNWLCFIDVMKKYKVNWLSFFAALGYLGFVIFLYKIDELSSIPTFTVACLALIFSYFAYEYSKEKFRLELMEKRLEIYENVVKFCSTSITYAGLSKHEKEDEHTTQQKIEGIEAAHKAFRGLGYHKYKMLFGPDIEEIFKKLNKSFAIMVVKGHNSSSPEYQEWIKKENDQLKFISDTLTELPNHFRPYLYFGDYKKR
jgi:hypothetical protein